MGAEPSPQDTVIGQVIGGRFKVEKKLAAGGMGVVYKAEQVPLGRAVAVKILRHPQSPSQDESFSKRFLLEAASVAKLNHPHTVVIHDYGRDGDLLYFAMEYLDGATLTGRVRASGPMDPADVCHVAIQIAGSVADAHKQGLVHRDLKPGNIMLADCGGDPNFAKVLDFGLVKMVSQQEVKLTQSGIMLGSPRYMAPEQVRGSDVDGRADIYSFGALICFALTGKPPYPAGSQFEAMRAHVYSPIPSLRDLDATCRAGSRLEAIVQKCLAKKPDERFQSFEEVIDALRHAALAPTDDEDDPKATVMRESKPNADAPPAPKPEPSQRIVPQTMPSGPQPVQIPAPAAPASELGPATALPKRNWALHIGAVVLIGLAAAVAAMLIPGEPEMQAEPLQPATDVATMEPATMEVVAADMPADMAADMAENRAPASTDVALIVDPPARVTRDGIDIGDSPLTLRIVNGDSWALELSAPDHHPQTIDVDGSEPRISVTLRPVTRREPRMRDTMATPMNMSTPMNMATPNVTGMRDVFHVPEGWD